MSLFSKFKEIRSKEDNIQNPCEQNELHGFSLSNLLKGQDHNPMALSAFFAGVNIISNSVAMMKWLFKDEDDNLVKKSSYLWHLFDNAKMTRYNMIKNILTDILLYGNGFIYIERDNETGKPKTLHYSPANQTSIFYNPLTNDTFFMNNTYSSKWNNGDDYLHFYMSTRDGYQGVPVKSYAYKTISLAGSTEKSAADYYNSGGTVYGIVSPNITNPVVGIQDKQLKELQASWDQARSQSKGTGTIFVPADIKFTQLSSNAKDSALVETRLYNVQEIARWLNISPVLLGDLSHNYYGSLSEAQQEFVIHTLEPYIVMMEEELTRKLIMPSRIGNEYVDLDENSILATDKEKQANYYNTLVKGGILSINEARHALGYSPVDGADDLIIPFTNLTQNTVGGAAEDTNTEEKQDEN